MLGAELKSVLSGVGAAFVLTISAVLSGAEAGDLRGVPVAQDVSGPSNLAFQANVDGRRWHLVVVGPAGMTANLASEGAPPTFALRNEAGVAVPDGVYSYELRVLGSDQDDGAMEYGPVNVVAGTIEVLAGVRVVPEADPGPGSLSADDLGGPSLESDSKVGVQNTAPILATSNACLGAECTAQEVFPTSLSNADAYLKLDGFGAGIVAEDTSSSSSPTRDWQIAFNNRNSNEEYFAVFDLGDNGGQNGAADRGAAVGVPFRIDAAAPTDALRVVGSTGNVGLGTAAPAKDLEIFDSGPTIRLSDNAGIEWNLNDSSTSTVFDVVSTSAGVSPVRHVYINRAALPDQLVLQSTGIGIGRFAPEAALDVEGEVIIRGDVSVLSSRKAKADFSEAASDELLEQLATLPILHWRYAGEAEDTRHLGPVAEDFYDRFGLGTSAQFLSPMDGLGVALATIKALDQRGRTMADALAQKERRIANLEGRIAALERLLSGGDGR